MAQPTTTANLPKVSKQANAFGLAKHDPDLSCILRARAGDPKAKSCLWELYWFKLFRYFVRNRTLKEEAEDLASETLVDAFDNLDSFRGAVRSLQEDSVHKDLSDSTEVENRTCSFKTYVYSIARYKLYNSIRHKKAAKLIELSEISPAGCHLETLSHMSLLQPQNIESDPLQGLIHKERLDEVCCALADVGLSSVEQFKVLLLHYFCELSHKEISELLSTPQKTVNSRLQTGRERMLKFYKIESDMSRNIS